MAVDPEGEAHIEVHANAPEPRLEREMRDGVVPAAEAVERDMKKAGDSWGEASSRSMGERLEREGGTIARRLEGSLKRQKVTQKVTVEFDRDNNVVRRWVTTTTRNIEDAFQQAGKPGGPFSRIGSGISDAIGAGFNVSGRSSLILFLIPLIGVIVGAVLGLIQLLNAAVALAASLPVLLGGIAVQVGAIAIAFNGMGAAIQGAFAAKNAKELNEAIKGLTPSAQKFVKELLPLRDMFKDIQRLTQEAFFKPLVGDIRNLINTLRPIFVHGFEDIGGALGEFVHQLLVLLRSPSFQNFFTTVFKSTEDFIRTTGPEVLEFFKGVVDLAVAATPLLTDFGRMLGGNLQFLGHIFTDIANDPDFQKFIKQMSDTIQEGFHLVAEIIKFIAVFAAQLNEAGGQNIIKAFADAFDQLAFFLSTPVGKKALEGLVDISIASIEIVTGLIETIFLLAAAVEFVGEALRAFFKELFEVWIPAAIRWFKDLWHSISKGAEETLGFFGTIPARILGFFKDAGSLLLDAGSRIMGGLIQGIKNRISGLTDVLSFIGNKISNFFPHSPAKEGPLSGQGDPMLAGQRVVQRLGEGMTMAVPSIQSATENVATSILFGRGSIVQNFNGLPNQEQARGIGGGIAAGIGAGLVARDVRLAVRTL